MHEIEKVNKKKTFLLKCLNEIEADKIFDYFNIDERETGRSSVFGCAISSRRASSINQIRIKNNLL